VVGCYSGGRVVRGAGAICLLGKGGIKTTGERQTQTPGGGDAITHGGEPSNKLSVPRVGGRDSTCKMTQEEIGGIDFD